MQINLKVTQQLTRIISHWPILSASPLARHPSGFLLYEPVCKLPGLVDTGSVSTAEGDQVPRSARPPSVRSSVSVAESKLRHPDRSEQRDRSGRDLGQLRAIE